MEPYGIPFKEVLKLYTAPICWGYKLLRNCPTIVRQIIICEKLKKELNIRRNRRLEIPENLPEDKAERVSNLLKKFERLEDKLI